MAAKPLSCVLLGEQPLLAQCADVLLELNHRVEAVLTTSAHNQRWCREQSVPIWRRADLVDELDATRPDLLISVTWPWIVPPRAIAAARRLAINYHDGPLPRYAGMNGSAWALLRGEPCHAVVWHVMTEGLDAGDILKRREVAFEPRETSVSLNIKNASHALEAFLELMNEIATGTEKRTPQDPSVERTVFSRHDRPERLAVLDLTRPAAELDRVVRACDFGPYPNPFAAPKLVHGARAVIVDDVEVRGGGSGTPGTVVSSDGELVVRTGAGALAVLRARTLDGVPLAAPAVAAALGVVSGDVLGDDVSPARQRVSRAVAEAEPIHLRAFQAMIDREPLPTPLSSAPSTGAPAPIACASDDPAQVAALVASFAFTVGALTRRSDVPLAMCRRPTSADLARTEALFLPASPINVAIDPAAPFSALVAQLREQLNALASRPPPLRDLIARTPTLSRLRGEPLSSVGVTIGSSPPPGAALWLSIVGSEATVQMDPARAPAGAAAALGHRLAAVHARLIGSRAPLSTIDVVCDAERARVIGSWNATRRPFPREERIHDGFERQARARPEALALVAESQRLTFAELDARANRIGNALRARGARAGTFVALCLQRNVDLVATLLGIAKTGAAYVPIDKQYPPERAAFMVEDSRALLVVTTDKLAERFPRLPLLLVDGPEVARASDRPVASDAAASDRCYVIYTSGSTGQPKGVLLTHRAVMNTLSWVNRRFEVGPTDRLLFLTSPSFDLSVYDVFGALGAGAVVEVASTERLAEPALLARRLIEPGVTIWDSAPAALARLMPFLPKRAPESTLRLVMLSGDWVPLKLPDQLRGVFDGVKVKALGGATEAAIWSNWFDVERVEPAWSSIPYGRPIDNARYYVLDGLRRPVPPGVAADLYIAGSCVAEGYLNRPTLTAERFVPDPFVPGERMYQTGDLARFWDDGTLEFLGREDFQVKVRGFRVELTEIEAALLAQPGVAAAVVNARKDAGGDKVLVAYVVAEPPARLDAPSLKVALARRLPEFMVPAFIVVLPRLPLTSNGKVDRAALPEPTVGDANARVAPRTDTERELVRLWQDVLRLEKIGVTDSFFDLGGHSLSAALLVTRMKGVLGVDVPLSQVISHPTVEALARAVDTRRGRPVVDDSGLLVPLREHGTRAPLFLVAGIGGHVFGLRDLALHLPADQPVFAFRAIGAEGEAIPKANVTEIAAVYEREVLARAGGRPVVIGGYSFGGLVAFELAQRLRRAGLHVERLIILDVFAPGYPVKDLLPVRLLRHARHFAKLDARDKRSYLWERARHATRRALVARGFGGLVAPEEADSDHLRTLWAALAFAQDRYTPAFNDPGPVTLFRATVMPDWPGVRLDDPAHGWRRWVSGSLEVIDVPGDHLQLLDPGNVEVIGAALSARLPSARQVR